MFDILWIYLWNSILIFCHMLKVIRYYSYSFFYFYLVSLYLSLCSCPDEAPVRRRMLYASSVRALKATLGLESLMQVQASDISDIDEKAIKHELMSHQRTWANALQTFRLLVYLIFLCLLSFSFIIVGQASNWVSHKFYLFFLVIIYHFIEQLQHQDIFFILVHIANWFMFFCFCKV